MKSEINAKERKNTLLYLAALFITNVGNSASFIICGKYSYDYFGLASVFGALLIMESLQAIIFSGFAGYWTDKIGAKKISVICDLLLFMVVLLGAAFAATEFKGWSIVIVYFVMNLIKPFQNTALFALTKEIAVKDTDLYHLNSKIGMVFQLGYLVGLGVTGFFIKDISLGMIMIFDSLTFLISGLLIFSLATKNKIALVREQYRSLFNLTKIKNEYILTLRKNNRFFQICLILGIQINLIVAYNTNLFKFVAENLGNKSFALSILESAYTLTCVAVGFILSKKNFVKIKANTLFYFLILQSVIFAIIPITSTIFVATFLALSFGLVSSVMFPELFSSLYKSITDSETGKVGGVKAVMQSVIAIPILILNSFFVDSVSLSFSYWFLSVVSIISCCLVFLAYNKNEIGHEAIAIEDGAL